jgi:hypothetical protein
MGRPIWSPRPQHRYSLGPRIHRGATSPHRHTSSAISLSFMHCGVIPSARHRRHGGVGCIGSWDSQRFLGLAYFWQTRWRGRLWHYKPASTIEIAPTSRPGRRRRPFFFPPDPTTRIASTGTTTVSPAKVSPARRPMCSPRHQLAPLHHPRRDRPTLLTSPLRARRRSPQLRPLEPRP